MPWFNTQPPPSAEQIEQQLALHRPSLVLLGKTGAGKSSLIAALTGDSQISIGNGFAPCTPELSCYPFPAEQPLLNFYDSRGLGEAGYDDQALAADLQQMRQQAQALIVLISSQDPSQEQLMAVLKQLARGKPLNQQPLLLVFSHYQSLHGSLSVENGPLSHDLHKEQQSLLQQLSEQIRKLWPKEVRIHYLDLSPDKLASQQFSPKQSSEIWPELEALKNDLAAQLPLLHQLLQHQQQTEQESQGFSQHQALVQRYALWASGSDSLPLLGWVSVPSIQLWMLGELAKAFDQPWGLADKTRFFTLLGSSFALNYGLKLGSRQIGKLIPGYGQTLGTGLSMALSYGSTLALGRAACWYFQQQQQGAAADAEQLQQIYQQALQRQKDKTP